MELQPILLRAHHGLCICFFQGRGYSPAFTAHMAAVIRRLEQNPPVQLTDQTDCVCACCPNNHGNVCESAAKVAAYDRAVLDLCGLKPGDRLPYRAFHQRVQQAVLAAGLRQQVCGDCQWTSLCRG